MNRRRASIVVGLSVTGLFLWLSMRHVDIAGLRRTLGAAKPGWTLIMLAIVVFDLAVRAVRSRILLSRAARAPLSLMFRLSALGLAINNVLFLRLGELTRAALAARRLAIPTATALASVVVERALDVCALLSLFVAACAIAPGFVPSFVRAGAALTLAGGLAALVLFTAAGEILHGPLSRWPRVQKLAGQLSLGAAVLREPAAAAACAALSLGLWMVDALLYWAGAQALGLGGLMDYPRSILVLSWAGAASAVPAAPGAMGTFEAVVQHIMVLFGAGPEQAFGYAVFNHMIMYVSVTAIGLFFLYRLGLSLGQLHASIEEKS